MLFERLPRSAWRPRGASQSSASKSISFNAATVSVNARTSATHTVTLSKLPATDEFVLIRLTGSVLSTTNLVGINGINITSNSGIHI